MLANLVVDGIIYLELRIARPVLSILSDNRRNTLAVAHEVLAWAWQFTGVGIDSSMAMSPWY